MFSLERVHEVHDGEEDGNREAPDIDRLGDHRAGVREMNGQGCEGVVEYKSGGHKEQVDQEENNGVSEALEHQGAQRSKE